MKVCVYCSSSESLDKKYYESAKEFGKLLAQNDDSLVYGGYDKGIMGAVAEGVKEGGGKIIGVIPEIFKDRNKAHLDEAIYTSDMAERKKVMEEVSDAFVTLPGGIGSMDEFFQVYTLIHLKQHNKKVCVYNFNNFYDDIYAYLLRSYKEGFFSKESLDLCPFLKDSNEVLKFIHE